MSIVTTDTQTLLAAANKAKELANEINYLLETKSIRELYKTKKILFAYNAAVMNGELGNEYKLGTIDWAMHGAVQQLMTMLDKDNVLRPQFRAGCFGSVWFDVYLTGGVNIYKRTKLVRICPLKTNDDEWTIVLDNTFDTVW